MSTPTYTLSVPEDQLLKELLPALQLQPHVSASLAAADNEEMSNTTPNLQIRLFKKRFLVKEEVELFSISCQDISYFEASKRYVNIIAFQGAEYRITQNTESVELLVNPDHFFRINRTLLISHASIAKISFLNTIKLQVFLQPTYTENAFVSKSRIVAFKDWLDQ